MSRSLEQVPLATMDMPTGQIFQATSEIIIHPKQTLTFMRWEDSIPEDPNRSLYADFEVFVHIRTQFGHRIASIWPASRVNLAT